MADTIEIEILPDGTIKFETDKVSGANHANADEFLEMAEELAGGHRHTKHKKDHAHHHHHGHNHVKTS